MMYLFMIKISLLWKGWCFYILHYIDFVQSKLKGKKKKSKNCCWTRRVSAFPACVSAIYFIKILTPVGMVPIWAIRGKESTGCDDQQLCDDNDDVDGMRYDITTKSAISSYLCSIKIAPLPSFSPFLPLPPRDTRCYIRIRRYLSSRGVGWLVDWHVHLSYDKSLISQRVYRVHSGARRKIQRFKSHWTAHYLQKKINCA